MIVNDIRLEKVIVCEKSWHLITIMDDTLNRDNNLLGSFNPRRRNTMACEAEKGAFKEAKQRVQGLRQTLKDYTGSDKPGGGAPSGNWPGGTHGSKEEV
jgi:hypothetical protein